MVRIVDKPKRKSRTEITKGQFGDVTIKRGQRELGGTIKKIKRLKPKKVFNI